MNPFKQRSSLGSSFVTGLVGWICFSFVGVLIFNIPIVSSHLILLAVGVAVVQVSLLRILFFPLQMHRHLLVGAFWGLLSALGLYFLSAMVLQEMKANQTQWLIIYAYIGAPVGAFLSYFYRDDLKILQETPKGASKNFGRDAHWLEPFAFGAVAYLLAFFPFGNLDFAVKIFFIGAIIGVFAAGSSHFSPDAWKHNILSLLLIIIGLGVLFGFISAWLFRAYSAFTTWDLLAHCIVASLITFTLTFLRGRQLALKEEKGLL